MVHRWSRRPCAAGSSYSAASASSANCVSQREAGALAEMARRGARMCHCGALMAGTASGTSPWCRDRRCCCGRQMPIHGMLPPVAAVRLYGCQLDGSLSSLRSATSHNADHARGGGVRAKSKPHAQVAAADVVTRKVDREPVVHTPYRLSQTVEAVKLVSIMDRSKGTL